MSYPSSMPAFDHDKHLADNRVPLVHAHPPNKPPTPDGAIDSALRSVPLPDGLMARLGSLVYAMPDDAAGYADWLGC